MIARHLITALVAIALQLPVGFTMGQGLGIFGQQDSSMTLEGAISYMDAQNNRIVVGDRTYRLNDIVQINGKQRLAEQAYRSLASGARVSITVSGEDKIGQPMITAIQTVNNP